MPIVCICLRTSSFHFILSIRFTNMSLSVLGSFNPISLMYFVPCSSTQSLPASPAPNSSFLPLPTALRIQSPLRPILRRSSDFLFLFFRVAVDMLVLSPLDYKKPSQIKRSYFLKIKKIYLKTAIALMSPNA